MACHNSGAAISSTSAHHSAMSRTSLEQSQQCEPSLGLPGVERLLTMGQKEEGMSSFDGGLSTLAPSAPLPSISSRLTNNCLIHDAAESKGTPPSPVHFCASLSELE